MLCNYCKKDINGSMHMIKFISIDVEEYQIVDMDLQHEETKTICEECKERVCGFIRREILGVNYNG